MSDIDDDTNFLSPRERMERSEEVGAELFGSDAVSNGRSHSEKVFDYTEKEEASAYKQELSGKYGAMKVKSRVVGDQIYVWCED